MITPRLFVPAGGGASAFDPSAEDVAQLVGALDVEGRGDRSEMLVAATIAGDLMAFDARERGRLAPPLQAALAHHEVTRGGPPPRVLAEEVYLLRIDLLEEAPDAPGLDDPVYLYGALTGPFPRGPVVRVRGQLTVSRSDLLAGFCLGAPFAFVAKRATQESFRTFGAWLPGDRADAIRSGRSLVLALPLLADDLVDAHGNELFASQVLFDVLSSLQDELRATGADTPFTRLVIPVPSRDAFVRDLERDGFEIEGDVATRDKRSAGLMSRLFGGRERVTIPREAAIEDLLHAARLALPSLGDAPETRALVELLSTDAGTRRAVLSRFSGDHRVRHAAEVRARGGVSPTSPDAPSESPLPAPHHAAAHRANRDEWMKDFVTEHVTAARPRPRLSRPTRAAERPSAGVARAEDEGRAPDWMKDFE